MTIDERMPSVRVVPFCERPLRAIALPLPESSGEHVDTNPLICL